MSSTSTNFTGKLQNIILPRDSKVTEYRELHDGFCIEMRVRATTKEEILAKKSELESENKLTFRVDKTYKNQNASSHSSILYRTDWRCQHMARHKKFKPSSKNTNCTAYLRIKVEKPPKKRKGMKSSPDDGYRGIIGYRHTHNHSLTSAAVLGERDVSPETKKRLLEIFTRYHSPKLALEKLKEDLRDEYGELYDAAAADRAICPDVSYCYRLYNKEFKPLYGDKDGVIAEHAPAAETAQSGMKLEPQVIEVDNSEHIKQLHGKITTFCNLIKDKVANDYDSYVGPVETFCKNANNLLSDSALTSALSMFGTGCSSIKGGFSKSSSNVSVQLKAGKGLGGGKARVTLGKSRKATSKDHGYSKLAHNHRHVQNRPKNPQDLSNCIDSSVILGENH